MVGARQANIEPAVCEEASETQGDIGIRSHAS